MNEADLTIVIPTYNRAHLITRTLDSISAQILPPKEVIVVDNNSSDDTIDILNRYRQRNLDFELTILKESKPGAAAARNRGLKEVETPFVMFFDSDDTMRPEHIKEVIKGLTADDRPEMVWLSSIIHFSDGRDIPKHAPKAHPVTDHLIHACFATQSVAMTTDLARRCGGWNESLMAWNDFEYGLRLILNARGMKVLTHTGVDIFHQPVSITGDKVSDRVGTWEKSLETMIEEIEKSPQRDKEIWKRWLIYRWVILEAHYAREKPSEHRNHLRRVLELINPLPLSHRLVLRLAYDYTRHGGRGAYYLYDLVNGR